MIEVITGLFQNIINTIPESYRGLFVLMLYTLFIVFYAIFIWKFYKFLSSRDIMHLNLNQYNNSSHPVVEKILVVALYIIEYIVILPFLVLFWYAILSIFLLLLSESENVSQILMIAAAIIAATRITSYFSEDLSKDIAKIIPFTVLGLFILNANLFDFDLLLLRIIEIPSLIYHLFTFLFFIFIIEFVLRMLYLTVHFFSSEEEREEEEN